MRRGRLLCARRPLLFEGATKVGSQALDVGQLRYESRVSTIAREMGYERRTRSRRFACATCRTSPGKLCFFSLFS